MDTIAVVGGIYQELCMRPAWNEIYGSGGRAASAIAALGDKVTLHGYASANARPALVDRAVHECFALDLTDVEGNIAFRYLHGLDTPKIDWAHQQHPPIRITANRVVRFGQIEGDAIVTADYAVYDPQNGANPVHFGANGSTAKHLALVLNLYEARVLSGLERASPEEMAKKLMAETQAESIVIKMGPMGAFVYDQGTITTVPAYRTEKVWKIGSGDTFVAHFGYQWMNGVPAAKAAFLASKATAFYCQYRGHATEEQLHDFNPDPLYPSARFLNGERFKVYLAGPFFTLAQLWLIEQARECLRSLGMTVFSPYHDVGQGSAEEVVTKDLAAIKACDVMFAVADGLDPGTMYEVGFAKANNKPVIVYSENESNRDKTMMQGSHCVLADDFVTAIYLALWETTTL